MSSKILNSAPAQKAALPQARLSLFYLFYFAILGAQAPYWSPYLKDLSFSAQEIGEITAIFMLTKIFAPSLWGWLGDHYGHRMRWVRMGCLVGFLAFCVIPYLDSYWPLVIAVALYSFFWNAALPQFEVVTLGYLGERAEYYSRIRLWGSVGFILMVVGLGFIIDHIGIHSLPWFMLGALFALTLTAFLIAEKKVESPPRQAGDFWRLLRQPSIYSFFIAAALMQVSHGPYYTFFSIYMADQGHSASVIGLLWALGVLAEVLLFWYMHRLLPFMGLKVLLVGSLLLATLRWILIGAFADSLMILLFAQLLHAATFGSFHAASIEYVRQKFGVAHAGQGQAFYSGVSFGGGAAIGALLSGYGWAWYGGSMVYYCAALVCAFAALLMWRRL